MACSDCGVSPMWPTTGISASTMRSTRRARFSPPSIFTASAPASLMKRAALRSASRWLTWYDANGMSATRNARFTPRRHRARVVQHLLHGDGQGVFVAQHHHAQRVADQDHVNAGFVHQPRAGVVVGGEAGDEFLALFLFEKSGSGDLGAEVAGGDTHDVLQCSSRLADTACIRLNSTPKTVRVVPFDAVRNHEMRAGGKGLRNAFVGEPGRRGSRSVSPP